MGECATRAASYAGSSLDFVIQPQQCRGCAAQHHDYHKDYANAKHLWLRARYVCIATGRQILPLLTGRQRENGLRGVQDRSPIQVKFTTTFCVLLGRCPHINFEVPQPGQSHERDEQDRTSQCPCPSAFKRLFDERI